MGKWRGGDDRTCGLGRGEKRAVAVRKREGLVSILLGRDRGCVRSNCLRRQVREPTAAKSSWQGSHGDGFEIVVPVSHGRSWISE
jgi:hypothetical protein